MLFRNAAVVAVLLTSTTLAAPIATTVSAAADFAANVLMTSGASQFAMWVPADGSAHATSGITCLNIGASSTGACDITSIDQVATVQGYTCAFQGSNGWSGSQVGTSATGWMAVAPPQTIISAACIAG